MNVRPQIECLKSSQVNIISYAGDGNAVGKLEALRDFHDKLEQHEHAFGYNITKCYIITKREHSNRARDIFKTKVWNL